MNERILQLAKTYEQETIAIRTYLYEHPEVSSKEYETSRYLKEKVAAMGLKIEEVEGTGFTALLDTGKPGRTIGIRTDIDALPVTENPNNLAGPRKYRSKHHGVMHACGHDGHMAIVLTTIKILTELHTFLTGKIYFIFEEGEEIGSGIDAMIEHLKGKQIEAIYGNHLVAFLESGKVSIDAGPKMAGVIFVDFTVHGKSGHGARPDLSVNPIFATANVLTGLTSAWANRIDVNKTVTLGLTKINGGTAHNVIPNDVTVGGTLRFYDADEGKKALSILKDVATQTAAAHQCSITFNEKTKIVAPALINDEKLADIAIKGLAEVLPHRNVEGVQWFASEPFSRYSELCPIVYGFIGMKNDTYGSGAAHHNDYFDVDENALIYGVIATTKIAVDFLRR
ncbi:amidohydrolase [Pseudogracilibacillus sp. ICA-222130]|uniref:amidohydrolase n=1 Tax=Pseudogracilibacillus sp. ICA-222130 TaxID=3134655 RepID=UPI0030C34E9B